MPHVTSIQQKMTCISGLIGLFLLFFSVSAFPAEFDVTVTGVTDGDTVRVLIETAEGKREEKVRLHQIDAPERAQPFGNTSRQYLAELVHQRNVTLQTDGRDRYGRVIGTLLLDDKSINAEMVRAGYAWAYRAYLEDEILLLLEGAARDAGRGLWQDAHPIPPWRWRRGERDAGNPADVDPRQECLPQPRCSELPDCDAAYFQLQHCGATRIDGDDDGIPCEAICSEQPRR